MASQRELREAYLEGLRHGHSPEWRAAHWDRTLEWLATLPYPPKMVVRPREVVGRGGLAYRVAVGELQVSDTVCTSRNWRPYFVDEMQRIVADLFANPTEIVESDD